MRKITFIAANEYASWGGSEMLWSLAAERLVKRGVEVAVSTKRWPTPVKQIETLSAVGCTVFYRRQPSLARRFWRNLFPHSNEALKHIRNVAAGSELVVISQGGNNDGLCWMEASAQNGQPYCVIVQSAAEHWWLDDAMSERLARAYESASAAYFVSLGNLELTRRQFVTPIRSARVVRNPFNVRYDSCPAWPELENGEVSLACVARLDPVQKGQDLLLEMLALPHWRTRNVRLSFIGSGVAERGLKRLAEQLRISVRFNGFANDIETVWSQHHALVLPSRYEGMPLALVEAMLCGRTCVVTDVAGHRELVRDGINGFLAKAPTVELLDAAMNRLWDSREHLRGMGHIAAQDVRRWVSPDPVEDFIRELTDVAG